MKLYFQHFDNPSSTEPPLIVLHGLFGSSTNWRNHCKQLAETFNVYAPDLRNHGESPHDDSMTFDDMVHDVLLFMNEHNLESAIILGHSMGGKVAMQLATQYPDRVKKLIVVDIAPKTYPPRHQSIFAAIDHLNKINIQSRKHADEEIENILVDQAERLFLLTNLKRTNNSLDWRINISAIKNGYVAISSTPETASAYTNPTLFIKGNKSAYISDADETQIKHLFPNAELKTIPDAGHWVHAEQPKMFIEIVLDFLNEE